MAFDLRILIGLIIGILAYSMLYLGKGIQKFGIEGYKYDKKVKVKSKNTFWWTFGTILTTISMFVHWSALLFAPINIIAPLEGIGLIALILYSYFLLKEKITKTQIIGISSIVIGTVLVPLFNINTGIIEYTDFNGINFVIFILVVLSLELVSLIISKFKIEKIYGMILSIIAGTFMAIQTVTKRITAISNSMTFLIFSLITFLMGIFTLIFTQLAFTKANANLVVPIFTSMSIIISIMIGVLTLNESLVIFQYIGITIIIVGVILLTGFSKN